MKQAASIFNDVLGPIMTGPSSSHTAGPCRIGLVGHQLCLGAEPTSLEIRFDRKGSFAASYNLQGTDRGLVGGLVGLWPDSEGLRTVLTDVAKRGIQVRFLIDDFEADHPNTAKSTVRTKAETLELTGQSIGGGMFRVIEVNGYHVEIRGDFYELLVVTEPEYEAKITALLPETGREELNRDRKDGRLLLHAKYSAALTPECLAALRAEKHALWVRYLEPVMPILSGKASQAPFSTNQELMEWIAKTGTEDWEAGAYYELRRGHTTKEDVYQKMEHIADVMRESVMDGLDHPIHGQIIPARAAAYAAMGKANKLIPLGVMNTAMAWSMAVVEVNSRYGKLVAAPTGGACGVIPGAILGTAEELGLSKDDVVKALFAAGIVGVFIAEHATFAAEIASCQAECGAGSAMAAAGVAQLFGGTPAQCAAAASMALQNVLGMICDSVADLVEVPCLGRNVLGTVNAIVCANMALAGVPEVIPLDETIASMLEVGNLMPSELCCTGKGGLAVTETSKCLKCKLGYC